MIIDRRAICSIQSSKGLERQGSLRLEAISPEMPWLIRNVLKLQKETTPCANLLTEAEIRRILFSKIGSFMEQDDSDDSSRELQETCPQ